MERSEKGSFTIPEIQEMLHLQKVTAYKLSKDPRLKRKNVAGQYRIRKSDFWKWYDKQTKYKVYDEPLNTEEYFSTTDIGEMLHLETDSARSLILRENLATRVSPYRNYVRKTDFVEWYQNQRRYTSDDPRLPEKWFEETYDIRAIKKMLGLKSNTSVYRLYKENHFKLVRTETQVLVDKQSFDKWFASQKKYPIRKEGEA